MSSPAFLSTLLGSAAFLYLTIEDVQREREQKAMCAQLIVLRSIGFFEAANALEEVRYRHETRYPSKRYSFSLGRDIQIGSEMLYRMIGRFDMADFCRQGVEFIDSGFTHQPTYPEET
jgi:hypothetical protein